MVEHFVANERVAGSNPVTRSNIESGSMVKGIGYLEYCKLRMSEGYTTQKRKDGLGYEQPGQERFVVYFARSHVTDFENGEISRGQMKIGQAKYLTAVMRTRNQPGNDFRCYAEIVLFNREQVFAVEKLIKKLYKSRRIKLTQNQKELYNFKDDELSEVVYNVVNNLGYEPKEVKFYV